MICPYCKNTGWILVSSPTPLESIPPLDAWVNGVCIILTSSVYQRCACKDQAVPLQIFLPLVYQQVGSSSWRKEVIVDAQGHA